MNTTSEAQLKAVKRYKAKHVKRVTIDLFPGDQDILDYLETTDKPAATAFKDAIRAVMKREA